uniref:Uncharacterized protein n=1 Tax=Meloidogyne incognita TaxID=6306 RepID=A0A914NNM1_MELIC
MNVYEFVNSSFDISSFSFLLSFSSLPSFIFFNILLTLLLFLIILFIQFTINFFLLFINLFNYSTYSVLDASG